MKPPEAHGPKWSTGHHRPWIRGKFISIMVVAARCLVLNPIVHHSRRPASCSARRLPRITTTSASPSPPWTRRRRATAPTSASASPTPPSPRRVHSLRLASVLLRNDYTRRSTDSLTYLQIFSASRLDIPSAWQMPQVIQSRDIYFPPLRDTREGITLTLSKLIDSQQGGIDQGEDPRAAAFRELREETGVTSAEMVAEVS
jgi:hypothetical protein